MNINLLNNKIVIIKDSMKNSLLKLISDSKKLLNIKIITLSELKRNLYFDYNNETIYYICKNYNVISDIAKIYLDNLYYINDLDDEKINFLESLKKDLDDNGLLIYNKLYSIFLNNKDIVLLDLKYSNKFYLNIFNKLKENNNVEYISLDKDNGKKDLYEASNSEEEVSFVASQICKLIKNGVSINNIKLANVSEEYYFIIKKTFSMFNIPVNLKSNSSIKGSKIVKTFKDNFYLGVDKALNIISELICDNNDKEIYKSIVDVVNSYYFIDVESVRDLIFSDIDKIKIKSFEYSNAVNEVSITDDIISDEEYVFLLNYNEGVIPVNHKDEEYLSDKIRSKLNISESYDLNSKEICSIRNAIKRIKNLAITYSKYSGSNEIYISSSYDEELFNKKDIEIDYTVSNLYNKIILTSKMDENSKYGTLSDELIFLKNHYKDYKYVDYSNKYSMIDKYKLYDFIGNKLSLSYSSVNNYFECSFKYYLDNVLRINKYEDSFEITIGNIFHHILSKCFNDVFDFEYTWNNEVENTSYEFNSSEKYFLSILKNKLIKVIEIIKNQLNYTQLNNFMYEKEIIINIDDETKVTFKGIVDKIMYSEFDGKTIVMIVDYKTGNPKLNINNSVYGLDMQLPIYVYLVKNLITDVKIGGFYLQKILNNSKSDEEEKDMLKLQGYSNSDESILEKVDSSYMDSNIIKSLRVGSNGFYSYSKVISDIEIDKLYDIVDNKIHEVTNNILNAKFDINPKKIKDELKGCKYCKYKDICYMKNEDIVELEYVSDIFGGDE